MTAVTARTPSAADRGTAVPARRADRVPVHPERTADGRTVLWRFGAGHGSDGPAWQASLDEAFAGLLRDGIVAQVAARPGAALVTLAQGRTWAADAGTVRTAAQRAAGASAPEPADPSARRRALEEATLEALDAVVGPYAAGHGGGVHLMDVEPDVVHVRLSGTCHGCPAAALTVHARLEGLIRRRAPWLDRVEVEGAQPSGWLDRSA